MKKIFKKGNWGRRAFALLLIAAMLVGYLPSVRVQAAAGNGVADPSTAMEYTHMLGTNADGNRYAGRIWTDKSVFALKNDASKTELNNIYKAEVGSDLPLNGVNDEFMTVFSALGSTTSVYSETTISGALDVVLVMDMSTSMEDETTVNGQRVSRLAAVANAANPLLESILSAANNRLAIVAYSGGSETLVPLGHYKPSANVLSVSGITTTATLTAANSDNAVRYSRSTSSGTNLQAGINAGMGILANEQSVSGRTPVIIVMTDGQANRAVNTMWYNVASSNVSASWWMNEGIALSTLLNAAYMKSLVEQNYDKDAMVFGIGVDLDGDDNAAVVMDPANAFTAGSSNSIGRNAYSWYNDWCNSSTTVTKNNNSWRFQQLPSNSSVTKAQVMANINYVESGNYFNVSSASGAANKLEDAFSTIIDKLAQAAWNPISGFVNQGGIDYSTPLTYVDFIGDYMEVKDIQTLTIFGNAYDLSHVGTSAPTYSVVDGKTVMTTVATYKATGTVTNAVLDPNAQINLNDAISVTVTTETPMSEVAGGEYVQSGAAEQTLRVVLNDDRVLPLISDAVENVNGEITFEEVPNNPLRVYYTVDVAAYVLDTSGNVIMDLVDAEYKNDPRNQAANGELYFYTNQYFEMNGGQTARGDAHMSAQPSEQNRYYYHQNNYPIYTSVTGNFEWEQGEYGVLYYSSSGLDASVDANNDKHADLTTTDMTYATVPTSDSQQVYTLVGFYRPTVDPSDAANKGEAVAYIVYADWGQLKRDTALYDTVNEVYVNYDAVSGNCYTGETGYVVDLSAAQNAINAYIVSKGITASDLQVYVGIGSWRQNRMDRMTRTKVTNATDTATTSYAPMLNTDAAHVGGLVVWLGNNGKVSRGAATGLKITKNVTEYKDGDGAATEFTITVTAPSGTTLSNIKVIDANGNALTSGADYTVSGDTITVNLTDDETVTILGLSAGDYTVAETGAAGYGISGTGAVTVTEGQVATATVTNDAIGYGDLLITKEVVNSLGGNYGFPTDEVFDVTVKLEPAVASIPTIEPAGQYSYNAVTGVISGLTIKHGQTIKIAGLPEGTKATVAESLPGSASTSVPGEWNPESYTSRDHSNAALEANADVTIHKNLESTVVITNTWEPASINVNVPVDVIKTYTTTATLPAKGETFQFQLQQYDSNQGLWVAKETKQITIFAADAIDVGAYQQGETDLFVISAPIAAPGEYNYKVVELPGSNTAITYDKTEHTFSVEVYYDNTTNALAYRVIGTHVTNGEIHAEFTNSLATASVAINMAKEVENKSGDPAKDTPAGFKFSLYEADSNWENLVKVDDRITNGLGTANWFIAYDKTHAVATGTHKHYYVVKEEMGPDTAVWNYDETEYRVTVQVQYTPADGTNPESLSASITKIEKKVGDTVTVVDLTLENPISFVNEYDPEDAVVDLNLIPTVKKVLLNKELSTVDGDIIFQIAKDHSFADDTILTSGKVIKDDPTAEKYGWVEFEPELTFDKVDTYHYYVREVTPDGAVSNVKNGITYDTSIYDMIITVTDTNNDGVLEASYYFEDATTQTVTFTNHYAVTEPATLTLSGTKTLNGRGIHEGEFSFKLTAYKQDKNAATEKWDEIRTQTVTNVDSDADGDYNNIVFPTITYTAANIGHTYKYVIEEVNAGSTIDGVTYSTAKYTYTVTVSDNGVGGVKLDVTEEAGTATDAMSFTNTYTAAGTSVSLTGTKHLIGRTQDDGEFTYVVMEGDTQVGTGTNDANGNIIFDFNGSSELTYNSVGQHSYTVTEVNGGTKVNGVTYDDTVYTVLVNVTDNGRGQLVAEKRINGDHNGQIVFNNHYSPDSVDVRLAGTKTFNGNLKEGQFSFGLYRAVEINGEWEIAKDAEGNIEPLHIVSNDASGNFEFPEGTFVAEGDYHYIVQEILPEGYVPGTLVNGVKYDTTQYHVVIKIGHNTQTGKLTYTKDTDLVISPIGGTGRGQTLNFTNSYMTSDARIVLQGSKTLVGRDMAADEFYFILTDENGNTVELVSNTAAADNVAGSFAFNTIEYDQAGTYYYTITEKWPMLEGTIPVNPCDGVLYSDASYTVTVEVVDNGLGDLVVNKVTVSNGTDTLEIANVGEAEDTWPADLANFLTNNIKFTNVYTVSGTAEITIQGYKVLTGRDMNADEFEFTMTEIVSATDKTPVENAFTDSVKNAAAKKGEKSAFTFETITYEVSDIGKHYYLVAESEGTSGGVDYDATEYVVTVEVADDLAGGLKITTTLTDGTNVFTAEGRDESEAMMAINLAFENSYAVNTDGTATIEGTKTLEGATIAGNQFAFSLYHADAEFKKGEKIETVKNGADGSVVFTKLTYTAADVGKHYYVVVEDNSGSAGYVYDESVWNVTVTVTDNGDGTLVTKTEMVKNGTTQSKNAFAFTNSYIAPADQTANLTVKKTVKNVGAEQITPEGFKFVLENQADNTKIEAVSDKDGNAVFEFKFTSADVGKIFTYKLSEVNTGLANVTYSSDVHQVKLIVTVDAATNTLKVTALTDGEKVDTTLASYENVYDYTEPEPTEPEPTVPETTEPKPTEPKPTEPKPTEPKPTEPKPTEPKPTEPEVTEPEVTEPEVTEPEPTDPDVPSTGDNAQLGMWITMLVVSGLGICAFVVMILIPRKKGKYEK